MDLTSSLHQVTRRTRRARGFSLTEILIAMALIGLLTAAAAIIAPPIIASGNFAASEQDVSAIVTALNEYEVANGTYPTTSGAVTTSLFGGSTESYYLGTGLDSYGNAITYTFYGMNDTPAYELTDGTTWNSNTLAGMQGGSDDSDTVTQPPTTGATTLVYNPDVGLYVDSSSGGGGGGGGS